MRFLTSAPDLVFTHVASNVHFKVQDPSTLLGTSAPPDTTLCTRLPSPESPPLTFLARTQIRAVPAIP